MDAVHAPRLFVHRCANECRLSRPSLADEQRDSLPAADGVLQVAQYLTVPFSEDEIPRVRRHIERPLGKTKECFVHSSPHRTKVYTTITKHTSTVEPKVRCVIKARRR